MKKTLLFLMCSCLCFFSHTSFGIQKPPYAQRGAYYSFGPYSDLIIKSIILATVHNSTGKNSHKRSLSPLIKSQSPTSIVDHDDTQQSQKPLLPIRRPASVDVNDHGTPDCGPTPESARLFDERTMMRVHSSQLGNLNDHGTPEDCLRQTHPTPELKPSPSRLRSSSSESFTGGYYLGSFSKDASDLSPGTPRKRKQLSKNSSHLSNCELSSIDEENRVLFGLQRHGTPDCGPTPSPKSK